MRCLNKQQIRRVVNFPVLYGKADSNVSIEVTAEKLAENLKKALSEVYVYDEICLYIQA